MTSLAVIIVSFNTRDLLDACLTALASDVHNTAIDGHPINATITVVDNASSDGSADMVAARHPAVDLRALDTNRGFTAANNLLLDRWVEDPGVHANPSAAEFAPDPRPDWVLLLNPDTEIQPGAIAALIRALQATPDAAVAGPRLAYGDGHFQHGAFRFPGIIQTWLDLFPVARLTDSTLNGRYPREAYERGRPFGVDFVLGACMLVRGTSLGMVGPLDEGFFMYCEEIDWCRRFRTAGWRTLCVPAALVIHHAGASTRQFRGPAFAALWRSRRRYFAKHAPRAKRVLIDAIIRLGLATHTARDRREVARGALAPAEQAERAAAFAAMGTMNDPHAAVTAVVLTLDEALHLHDCLASLAWADAVLVLDSGSRDATVAIAQSAGARVETHPFANYSRQRQHALALVTTPWVIFVDADERVTPELAAEVRIAISQPESAAGMSAEADPPTSSSGVPAAITPAGPPAAGYWIPRRNDFWGHWMRGGGWWPDRQLRLLRVDRVRYDPSRAVHEVAQVDGPTGSLTHPLIHLNYASLAEFRAKQAAYARLEAERRLAEGRRVRPHNLLLQPWREFYRRYVTLAGWKDGGVGLVACGLMAWYELRALVGVWRGGR